MSQCSGNILGGAFDGGDVPAPPTMNPNGCILVLRAARPFNTVSFYEFQGGYWVLEDEHLDFNGEYLEDGSKGY